MFYKIYFIFLAIFSGEIYCFCGESILWGYFFYSDNLLLGLDFVYTFGD